jgi:hypothetical protein
LSDLKFIGSEVVGRKKEVGGRGRGKRVGEKKRKINEGDLVIDWEEMKEIL